MKTARTKTTAIRTGAFVDDDSKEEGTWHGSDIE
jgi:hypothetical protein